MEARLRKYLRAPGFFSDAINEERKALNAFWKKLPSGRKNVSS